MSNAKSNVVLKEFWSDNERFADLFNTVFFQGKNVLKPEDMEEKNVDLSSVILMKGSTESLERYRDVVKCAKEMELVILGIENQDKIHYAMPLRCRIYDDLQYLKQVQDIVSKNRRKKNWKDYSADEFLSGMRKEDRIRACFTIVIYYGEDEWEGPRSLMDMVKLPDALRAYFQDYQMHLLCVREEDGSNFHQKDVRDLFYVLNKLYHDKEKELMDTNISVNADTYRAISAVQKNEKRLKRIAMEQKGEINMCSALDRIWENGKKEGIKEALKEHVSNLLGVLSREQIAQAFKITLEQVNEIAEENKELA